MFLRIKNSRVVKQFAFFLGTNSYLAGFIKGRIFTGRTKKICVPGLNCYSCPGALFSCPIGALQQIMGAAKHTISFYTLGFMGAVGMVSGRFVCGYLCPFGMLQDILGKASKKKIEISKWLTYIKYIVLGALLITPFVYTDAYGQSPPVFCSYICPSGTFFAGIPLLLANKDLRDMIGRTFYIKITIFLTMIVGSIPIKRLFCKTLCPLGAFYALFNKWSFYQMKVDEEACIQCGMCKKVCPMDVYLPEEPQAKECIRCLECKKICPTQAISSGFRAEEKKKSLKSS